MTPFPFRAAALLLSLFAARAMACSPVPPPVLDIDANRYYMDKNNSVIDPVLKARNEAQTKPVDEYLFVISSAASAFQVAPKDKASDAACALNWLSGWAGQKALLGKMTTEQSFYTRKWALAGLALSYAKLRPAASAAQQRDIDNWLKAIADATMAHSDAHKGRRNNHYYWEGLAVTAVGGVTQDARYLNWGKGVFEAAMSHVAPDGSLPMEMERAVKALHYHVFAVTPLVMMASILDVHSPRLDQLVQFTMAGAKDPSAIEKSTGFVQERTSESAMTWKIIYARHEPNMAWASSPRAIQPRLGGDFNLPNPLEHLAPR